MWRSMIVVALLLAGGLAGVAGVAGPVSASGRTGIGAGPAAVRLPGIVPAAVGGARPAGPLPGRQRLFLQVGLRLRHVAGLSAAIAELSDPASPGYQRFLTPAQLARRYGPTEADLRVVVAYLRSAGISVLSVSPQRNLVDAVGTVATAEQAFGVRIMRWRGTGGSRFYAPTANPVLPGRVGRLVLAVTGLDDLARLHPYSTGCTTKPAGGAPSGTCAEPGGVSHLGYSPAQLRKAYGLARLSSSDRCQGMACDGHGQYIGLLEFGSGWDPDNEAQYDSQYGLNVPSPSSTVFCPKGVSCPIPVDTHGGSGEADLDVEVAHAIAPGARVLVYESPKGSQIGEFPAALGDLLSTMLNGKAISAANSISYGVCESDVGSNTAKMLHQQFMLLAMRGEAFFAASGDSGEHCQTTSIFNKTEPSYPASDPLVTAVGGTNLFLNPNGSYAYEYAWSESGGGVSSYGWNTRPSWQAGPGIPAGKRRLVPDVSANAFCSLSVCLGQRKGYDYDTRYQKAALGYSERTWCTNRFKTKTWRCWTPSGGTSASSPLWAAVAAVYDQYAASSGRIPLNANVNAQLYDLAFKPHLYPGALTDVVYKAENGSDLYQNAAKGWDAATGLGSPQAYTMALDLPGLTVTPPSGPAGTAITVTGDTFWPGEKVKITDGRSATVCTAVAASDGTVGCTGKIPASAAFGYQHINATGRTSGGRAMAIFDVATATEAPLPPGAAANPEVFISSVACPTRSVCLAAGGYSDAAQNEHGLLLSWSGGKWTPVKSPLPAGAGNSPVAGVVAVACPSASICLAAGFYSVDSSIYQGLLLTWSNGKWTAIKAPLPGNAGGNPNVTINGLACPSATTCLAVGSYLDASLMQHPLALTWSAGTWSAASTPLPADAGPSKSGVISVLSCAAGHCLAAGSYLPSAGNSQGLLLRWSAGAWTPARAPILRTGENDPVIQAVTCAAAGTCFAAGFYFDPSGTIEHGLLLTWSNGKWTAAEAPAPAGSSGASLYTLACSSASSCFAAGYYSDARSTHGLLLTWSQGTWTAAEAPLPPDAGPDPLASIHTITCLSASNCLATGGYSAPTGSRGLLLTWSKGTWTAAEAPLPANASPDSPDPTIWTQACASATACIGVGNYNTGSATQGALLRLAG